MTLYPTSFNTPFVDFDTSTQEQMNKLYATIMYAILNEGYPYVTTIIWMNDNFINLYLTSGTEEELYKKIFTHFTNNNPKIINK